MKKLKSIFVAALAIVAILAFVFTPIILAGADEVSTMPEISAGIGTETTEDVADVETPTEDETVENTENVSSYYYTESEEKSIRFDFLDESNVSCVLLLNGEEVATVNATYNRIGGNVVEIYAMGDWMGTYRLNADGSAINISYQYEEDEGIPAEGESIENSSVLDEETPVNEPIIDEDVDKFLQPILCGAAGLCGTLIVVVFVLVFLKKYGKEIKEFLKWLRERKLSFENEEKTLKTIDEHILSTYNKLEELREKNGTEYAEVLKLVKDLISTVLKENADTLNMTDEHYHKIMKILEMLAVGNSELVRKGVADNIVKEIETADKV